MLSLASFELVAIGFCVAVAGFLLGCLVAALLTEPADDPFGDAAHGDYPAIPQDFKTLFHASDNIPGRQ